MNVGAPILDVTAYKTSDTAQTTTTSTSTPTATNPNKLITGGVVSAPGYAPVVITANANTAAAKKKGVFIPTDVTIAVKN
jgi:hypothetical protein